MSGTIVDLLSSLITPQITGSLASRLGESETSVDKALKSGGAALLASIAGRAGDTSLLQSIFQMITGAGSSLNLLGNLGALAMGTADPAIGDLSSRFLSLVLGGNQSGVADSVARTAGFRNTAAGSGILNMAAPLVLGLLGQKVRAGGLSAASLGSVLASESTALERLLPAGIDSLLSSAGGGHLAHATAVAPHHDAQPSGSGWMFPAVVGAMLIGLLFWFLSQTKEPAHPAAHEAPAKVESAATSAATSAAEAWKAAWAALGELFRRKLPNGIELNIPRLGVESRLIDFIEDKTKAVDKTTWFDFDRLLFDTGKATLQPASQEQLENVAHILKAFPNVNMKIGGYTDNTGDKAANVQLSQDRATSVMNELIRLGIDKARLEAEGYGEQHPVADNATEEGRAKNRRVSMRVTKK